MLLNFNVATLAQRLAATWGKFHKPKKLARRSDWLGSLEALESRELLTTFTVTSLADVYDPDDGLVTLREAVEAANETAAPDTIEFFIGLSGSIKLTQGEMQISNPLTMRGNGATQTVIDAQNNSRAFLVHHGAGEVTFDSLKITGGAAEGGGGAIYVEGDTNFNLIDSTLTGNSVSGHFASGAGIGHIGTGALNIQRSDISFNSIDGMYPAGGGVYAFHGSVNISDSKIENNSISGTSGQGAGISVQRGQVTITNSSIKNNSSTANYTYGAGIASGSGDLMLVNSTISGNSMQGQYGYGAGVFTGSYSGPNGVINPDVVVEGCTITGNGTTQIGYGGGIYVPSGMLLVKNTTISGNASFRSGGGITLSGADLTVINSTIVLNSVGQPAGLGVAAGGIASQSGDVTILNSIVAMNSGDERPDLLLGSGQFVLSHSLIGDASGTTLTESSVPDVNGNLIGSMVTPIDPMLGPLAMNGGPTATHALLGGPAINGGNNTWATDANLTVDQTGRNRFDGSAVDMGAFELQSPAVTFTTSAVSVSESVTTYVVTVQLSAASVLPVTVPFTLDGTADLGTDYTIGASPLVIPAGDTSGVITITVTQDLGVEPNETIVLTLGTLTNAIPGDVTSTTVTIVDNNTPPVVTMSHSTESFAESAGVVTLTVNLNKAIAQDVLVPFTVTGSALNPTDYTISASPVLIPAGHTSATITLTIANDLVFENAKTVIVTLGVPANATLGATAVDTVTINDDDFVPEVSFSTDMQTVSEQAGTVTVTVTLSGPAPFDVTVPFGTSGSASKPEDFSVVGNHSIVIPAGKTSESITLNLVNDSLIETDELVTLTIGTLSYGKQGTFGTHTVTIVSDDINHAPVIPAGQSFTIPENSSFFTTVGTVIGSDPDQSAPYNTFAFELTGNPGGAFSIDPQTGVIVVLNPSAINFEATPQIVLQVTATDNAPTPLSFTRDVTVHVTDVNDQPEFLTPNSVDVPENIVTSVSISAADPDSPAQALSFSIVGGQDADRFTINPQTGALTFKNVPNFEAPHDISSDNFYQVQIKVQETGAGQLSNTQTFAIHVTNVNEQPSFSSGTTASVPENSTAVMTVSGTDPDLGQVVKFEINGGPDASKFTINPTTGALKFISPPNFEAPADADTNNVYVVTIKAFDSGNPSLFTNQNAVVTVTNANDAPTITSSSNVSIDENSTQAMTVTASDVDVGQSQTFSIDGGNDAALFAINPVTGVLSFLTAPDFEAPTDDNGNNVYRVTVKVADNGSPSLFTTNSINVTVTNANEGPVFTSSGLASLAENSTAVATVTATDPEAGQSATFSIAGGLDAILFAIDPVTGQLSFLNAPNFDLPGDSDGDNIYQVTVQATDNGSPSASSTQNLSVSVTDILDTPVISGGSGTVTYLKMGTPVQLMPGIDVTAIGGDTSLGKIEISYFIPKKGLLSDVSFDAAGLGTVTEGGATTFKKSGGVHTLTILLDQGVTVADVETFLKSFRFSSKKMDTAKKALGRKIDVQVFDRQGVASNKLTTQIQAKAK